MGWLEFAGAENDGPSEKRGGGWNLQDWKMTDEIAGVEFAGLENDGLENDGLKNDGVEQEETYMLQTMKDVNV